ncbi:hypothetical protein [Kitasatospora brasiliensis]|uniref:hypothetical protein n=1 Tax=Kitasatospora brasiliensis TaxID=3058040 RepID=UPI002930CC31|nr:hypothetical protein [Kitasatospora sp. K002]
MRPKTPEQLNAEIHAGWEHIRSSAITVAELQAAMWGDTAELMAGLATGRLPWGEVYSEYWKFVADEDPRFFLELGERGTDYARDVAEVTRWHEQRLRDHFHRIAWGDLHHIDESDRFEGGRHIRETDLFEGVRHLRETDCFEGGHHVTETDRSKGGHHTETHRTTGHDGTSRPNRRRRRRRHGRRGGHGTHGKHIDTLPSKGPTDGPDTPVFSDPTEP